MRFFKYLFISIVVFAGTRANIASAQSETGKCPSASLQNDIDLAKDDTLRLYNHIYALLSHNKEMDDSIKVLVGQIDSISSSTYTGSLLLQISERDSLRTVKTSLTEKKGDLINEISRKLQSRENVKKSVTDLDKYSQIKINQELNKNLNRLARKYSELSLSELRVMESEADAFSSCDRFSEYRQRIKFSIANVKLYEQIDSSLHSPFNRPVLIQEREALSALLDNNVDDLPSGRFKLTRDQFNELDTLDMIIARYGYGINELQDLVNLINSDTKVIQCRRNKDRKGCVNAIDAVIRSKIRQPKIVEKQYFVIIPYLKELFENYKGELNRKPFEVPTKTEKRIMELL